MSLRCTKCDGFLQVRIKPNKSFEPVFNRIKYDDGRYCSTGCAMAAIDEWEKKIESGVECKVNEEMNEEQKAIQDAIDNGNVEWFIPLDKQ